MDPKTARVYSPTPVNLRRLAAKLQRGELVAIPTETVYGLAADALNARACQKIFQAKGRPANDPLIVHTLNLTQAELLAEFNDQARQLAAHFWPGPLTLILPKKACIPDVVSSGRSTVAIRVPAHPLARRILRLAGIPLAAPSANPFGYISPTNAAHVCDGLGLKIQAVLNGGPCKVGVESTILDLTRPTRPRILRPGVITASALEEVLRMPVRQMLRPRIQSKPSGGLLAPGMLSQHYSPHTPLVIKSSWRKLPPQVAGISVRKGLGHTEPNFYWLSAHGNLAEIARNLYQVLRTVDQGHYREIWIEQLPLGEDGLAAAITDRISRAAAKR